MQVSATTAVTVTYQAGTNLLPVALATHVQIINDSRPNTANVRLCAMAMHVVRVQCANSPATNAGIVSASVGSVP